MIELKETMTTKIAHTRQDSCATRDDNDMVFSKGQWQLILPKRLVDAEFVLHFLESNSFGFRKNPENDEELDSHHD